MLTKSIQNSREVGEAYEEMAKEMQKGEVKLLQMIIHDRRWKKIQSVDLGNRRKNAKDTAKKK